MSSENNRDCLTPDSSRTSINRISNASVTNHIYPQEYKHPLTSTLTHVNSSSHHSSDSSSGSTIILTRRNSKHFSKGSNCSCNFHDGNDFLYKEYGNFSYSPLSSSASIKSDTTGYHSISKNRLFEKPERPRPVSFSPEMVIATPIGKTSSKPDKQKWGSQHNFKLELNRLKDKSESSDCSDLNFEYDFEADLKLSDVIEDATTRAITSSNLASLMKLQEESLDQKIKAESSIPNENNQKNLHICAQEEAHESGPRPLLTPKLHKLGQRLKTFHSISKSDCINEYSDKSQATQLSPAAEFRSESTSPTLDHRNSFLIYSNGQFKDSIFSVNQDDFSYGIETTTYQEPRNLNMIGAQVEARSDHGLGAVGPKIKNLARKITLSA